MEDAITRARAARLDLEDRRIQSDPVSYLYYLLQGNTNIEVRTAYLDRYIDLTGLSTERQQQLRSRLASLDARRASPKPAKPRAAWLDEPATAKQLAALVKAGYRGSTKITKGDARYFQGIAFKAQRMRDSNTDGGGIGDKIANYVADEILHDGGFF